MTEDSLDEPVEVVEADADDDADGVIGSMQVDSNDYVQGQHQSGEGLKTEDLLMSPPTSVETGVVGYDGYFTAPLVVASLLALLFFLVKIVILPRAERKRERQRQMDIERMTEQRNKFIKKIEQETEEFKQTDKFEELTKAETEREEGVKPIHRHTVNRAGGMDARDMYDRTLGGGTSRPYRPGPNTRYKRGGGGGG